jgi:hypothetical protein
VRVHCEPASTARYEVAMPFKPKCPAGCDHLDFELVSRTLAKHFGDVVQSAKELGVSRADLRRLTWHDPKLLDLAHEEMELVVLRARGELIKALDSEDPKRRMWAADGILASHLAKDHPLGPAPRGAAAVRINAPREVVFRWRSHDDDKTIEGDPARSSEG